MMVTSRDVNQTRTAEVTLNGDVIRGNEYQEDGQSKLFTIQKSIRTETVVFVL